MTYSLLLHSLDPKPTRQELEEISVKVPSVARADCAYMLNDWFGIAASGLPLEDAQAFQAGLRGKGIASDVVADLDIPSLHHDFRCQRIDLHGSSVTLTTAMNRRQDRDKGELVFAAAGFVDREKTGSTTVTDKELRWTADFVPHTTNVTRSAMKFEERRYFRIDLFFSTDPHRVSLEIDKETVCFYGERPIRLKNATELLVLMVDLQSLLPPERLNGTLRDLALDRIYPTMHAYEEEIRWAFYRLGAKG
jgi:hypothetical protein